MESVGLVNCKTSRNAPVVSRSVMRPRKTTRDLSSPQKARRNQRLVLVTSERSGEAFAAGSEPVVSQGL